MQDISANNEAATTPARRGVGWFVLSPAWSWALTLFLGYRVLWSVWAAWVSSVYPYNPVE